jgi:NAD(P)-dependent dehydrogenase (short-subunit alcohol dehydrogenase family)
MQKIILITGATDGIGKETARTLAAQGHTVIIHGRNRQKAEAVRSWIITETGNYQIDIMIADLLSLADVKKAAIAFKQQYPRLDVLINNAGAFFGKVRETTPEGLEKTITLNLLAPVLLTELLLETLADSPAARIINLYSAMHKRGGKPDFSDFQLTGSYKPDRAYGLSKLYLVWVTRHLAARLDGITVNATHPGAVATNFGQDADKGFFINMVFKIALRFMDKVEDGARSTIYLATSPDVATTTGQFFDNKAKVEKPDDRYYSKENEQIVWEYCMNILRPYLKK